MKRTNLKRANIIETELNDTEGKMGKLQSEFVGHGVSLHNGVSRYLELPEEIGLKVMEMLADHYDKKISELEKELKTL